jgi:hypothetical protein
MITGRQTLLYALSFAILLAVLLAARANVQRVPVLKQVEFRNQTAAVIDRLTLELNEAEGCEPALAGQHVTPGQSQSILLAEPRMHSGQEIENGLVIEEMTLATGAADMKLQISDFGRAVARYPASLRFLFRSSDNKIRVNWKQSGPNELGIKLYVWLDATGKIVSCHSPNSAAAFCNTTNGFYWRQECRPTLRVTSPAAADSSRESGFGTCRFNGFQAKCPLGQVSQASCTTGRCLTSQSLCQKCE